MTNRNPWAALRWLSVVRFGIILAISWWSYVAWSSALIPFEVRPSVRLICLLYGVGATLLFVASLLWPRRLGWYWVVGACLDLLCLVAILHFLSGSRSGLAALVPLMVAGSSVLARPRWAISLAAAATLALLGDAAWRSLQIDDQDASNLALAGILGLASFLAAGAISWLSARLQAQEELAQVRGQDLRRQLAVTRRVISQLEQGVVLLDARQNISMLNPAAQQLLDLPALESISKQNLGSAAWQKVLEALQRLAHTPNLEHIEIVSQQSEGPRLLRVRAISTAEGLNEGSSRLNVSRLLGDQAGTLVLIDDVQALQEKAQQLKLAAMGRLSASIAHEIRNPLSAIRHANSLLAEQFALQDTGSGARLTRIVEVNTVRINTIVEDVLAIARRDRAQLQKIALAPFLRLLLEEHLLQKGVAASRVEVRVSDDAQLDFDADHLRQILVNLLDNALRFSPDQVGSVRIDWQANKSLAQLRLLDAGPGIAPEQIEHVFEPFYTTHTQGTGLGLYLVREWCMANQAHIRYQRFDTPEIGLNQQEYRGAFIIEASLNRTL